MHENQVARQQRLAYEKTLYRYSIALESGDLETLIAILHEAENDPYLEQMIIEAHQEGYQKEEPRMQKNSTDEQTLPLMGTNISYETRPMLTQVMRPPRKRWLLVLQNLAAALIVGVLIVGTIFLFLSHSKTNGGNQSPVTGGPTTRQGDIIVTVGISGTNQAGAMMARNAQTGGTLWQHKLGTNIDYNIRVGLVVQDHVVYLAYNKQVQAFQADDGKLLWKTTLGTANPVVVVGDNQPALIVDSDQVYASGYVGGNLYTLNAKTGKVLWHHDAPIPPLLAVNKGIAYVIANGTEDNNGIKALRKTDGKVLWQHTTTAPLSATVANNVLFVQTAHSLLNDPDGLHKEQKPLIALDATRGQLLWSRIAPAKAPSPLVVAQNVVVLFDGGHFCGYHVTSGERVWCTAGPASNFNGAGIATDEGIVYGLSSSSPTRQVLDAIDPLNGKVLWSTDVAAFAGNLQVIPSGNRLIVPGEQQVTVLSRSNGHQLWQAPGFILTAAAGS